VFFLFLRIPDKGKIQNPVTPVNSSVVRDAILVTSAVKLTQSITPNLRIVIEGAIII
jgi:hypothetical protein